jgi:hypothetical protein
MTLNSLRTSRGDPQLSAAAHFHARYITTKQILLCQDEKIIAHEKLTQRQTWAPHGKSGNSLGPAMHHYICENVYISSTASEGIIDTLEFFPHNLPMPQISSTDRLLMATNGMTDALKHTHPDVPLSAIGDETITALAQQATLFKNKFQKPLALGIIQRPIKAAENKQLSALIQTILTSPMKHTYQAISQN